MINLLIDTQEDLVQRLHTAEGTIKELLDQQTPSIYTTVFGNDNENGAGQGTMKQLSLNRRKRKGTMKQLSLNRRKRKVHFEMPVAPPRFMRMVEEVECENDVLEEVECENDVLEEGQALLPHPLGITLLGNPGHTEKLQLNRERRKNERKAISSSRPRIKASPRPQLTLIPANLSQKTKRAPPVPSSPNIRVTAEFHSNDQPETWEEDRK